MPQKKNVVFHPVLFFISCFAGLLEESARKRMAYLLEENRILKRHLAKANKGRRLRLENAERARLGRLAFDLGRKNLSEMELLFTPETLLKWYRELVAKKYTASPKRSGRKEIEEDVQKMIVKLAEENESWGGQRIADVMKQLGWKVSKSSILRVLKAAGLPPGPERKRGLSWSDFMKRHWETIGAMDFTTIEILGLGGLKRMHLLFAMQIASRRVQFVGMVDEPNEAWMVQKARELTDCQEGFLLGNTHLLLDRGTVFHGDFARFLEREGVKIVKLPPKSPNLNAHMERFFRSLKGECLNKMLFFSEGQLRRAVHAYVEHYHKHRPHQGLDGEIIEPESQSSSATGEIRRIESLGGMLNHYRREAA